MCFCVGSLTYILSSQIHIDSAGMGEQYRFEHRKTSLLDIHHKKREKKTHPSSDRCVSKQSFAPIIQPLAPCFVVGCWMVIGAVPRITLYGLLTFYHYNFCLSKLWLAAVNDLSICQLLQKKISIQILNLKSVFGMTTMNPLVESSYIGRFSVF